MPDRRLRAALLTSRWARVSVAAQNLYIRLMLVVCDYGLMEADPKLLSSICYPIGYRTWPQKVADLLLELEKASLVRCYEVEGKRYVQILRWHDNPRGVPKFPLPADVVTENFRLSPRLFTRELEKSDNHPRRPEGVVKRTALEASQPIISTVPSRTIQATGSGLPVSKPKSVPKPLPRAAEKGCCQPGEL